MRHKMSSAQHKMLGVVQNRYVAVKAGPHTMLTSFKTLEKIELFNRELDFTQRAKTENEIATMDTLPNGIRSWNINTLIDGLNGASGSFEHTITPHHISTFFRLAEGNRVDHNMSNNTLITQLRLADFFNSDSAKKTIEKKCANRINRKQIRNYVLGNVESSDDFLQNVIKISNESPAFKKALWRRFSPVSLRRPAEYKAVSAAKTFSKKPMCEFSLKVQNRYPLNNDQFFITKGAMTYLWHTSGPNGLIDTRIDRDISKIFILDEDRFAIKKVQINGLTFYDLSMPENITAETILLAHILNWDCESARIDLPPHMTNVYRKFSEYTKQKIKKLMKIVVQEEEREGVEGWTKHGNFLPSAGNSLQKRAHRLA